MKSIYSNTFTTFFCLSLAMTTNLYATDSDHEKHEKTDASSERVQHGSHEHGEARLTMAKTDIGMEISLETPAANVFGFEHKANDVEDHKTVQAAKEKLTAGGTLFVANKSANCKLKSVDIDSAMLSGDKKYEDHDDDHKDDKHHDEKETHNDVDVTWVFNCEKPKALESVATTLFSQFPKGFEHLNVEWITSKGAGTVKLEADGSVKFK